MIELMRDLKGRGYRMALLTNNVREWEPLWRAMLPVDEIFEVVVDSAFVGIRKPEPEIYELTLERIGGGIGAAECLFVDDVEDNVAAARQLGMTAVQFRDADREIGRAVGQFRSTDQAIAEIEAALDRWASCPSPRGPRCRAAPPRRPAPSAAAGTASRARCRARAPR